MSKHSEACCRIPPVIDSNYTPKGTYKTISGMKTYVTGPESATTAILSVYDIFGFFPQTLQGADIIANSNPNKPMQVYMPDFFDGNPADIAWYPPDNEEKQQKLQSWFGGAAPPKHLPKISPFITEVMQQNAMIKEWGIIGYCWGGKMVSLIGGRDGVPFKAGVQTSPAMVDPSDAEKVKIPMMVLASKEEEKADVEKYGEGLKVKKHVEIFGDQLHGWMSARADLKDSKVKAEYERGYKLAAEWFAENL